jgi:hypothetical protein
MYLHWSVPVLSSSNHVDSFEEERGSWISHTTAIVISHSVLPEVLKFGPSVIFLRAHGCLCAVDSHLGMREEPQVRPTAAAASTADPNDEVHMNTYVDRPYDPATGYGFHSHFAFKLVGCFFAMKLCDMDRCIRL